MPDSAAGVACYMRQLNRAEHFHQSNGHPSAARMEMILSRNLVANPQYTMTDLLAWNKICHGCNMGKSERLPHVGTHAGLQQFAADVIVYMDNFGRTPYAHAAVGRKSLCCDIRNTTLKVVVVFPDAKRRANA